MKVYVISSDVYPLGNGCNTLYETFIELEKALNLGISPLTVNVEEWTEEQYETAVTFPGWKEQLK